MKKLLFILCVLLAFATTALAAPLDDADKVGNFAATVYGMHDNQKANVDALGENWGRDFDREINFGLSVDVAVAPKFILGLDFMRSGGSSLGGSDYWVGILGAENKLTSYSFKAKYQAYKNKNIFIAPYIGLAVNKANTNTRVYDGIYNNEYMREAIKSKNKTSVLVGFTLVSNFDKDERFKGYIDAGIGNKLLAYNIGISATVTKNFEVDFGYKYHKVKGLDAVYNAKYDSGSTSGYAAFNGTHGNANVTSKGFYVGLTYKFK